MKSILNKAVYIFLLIGLFSCKKTLKEKEKLFTQIDAEFTGVDFVNKISESEDFHYYQYIYSYNGGGVAAADFNNDGLVDLFFTANTSGNKLYLNKGDFQFEDITKTSQIKNTDGFNTGVSVVDINNDGFLDIYVCRAGWFEDTSMLKNLLYINNGNLTFTEKAEDYGLADNNRTIAASFFDYDNDGDLDVYLANAPKENRNFNDILDLDKIKTDPKTIELRGSDKLYNNDNGYFKDVSEEAGIFPEQGFGLNPQVGDLNNDGWLDIYVSNDFNMPDFAFINNSDGTFSDKKQDMFKHMAFYSMGSDIADVNNDGFYDLMALDMNPEDYVRSKTTMSMTSISKFWEMVEKGYQFQYMHNMLQLNNGNGTFSEIGNMSGIANTDWSWSTLLADFDLDGYNDIYVTNGVFRDVIDKDTNTKILDLVREKGKKPTKADFYKYTQMLPQQKLKNYFFKNNRNLTFSDTSSDWANMQPTFSNGAVYADLDNDGDLDLVVNNINEKASILKNNAKEFNKGNYLQIQYSGADKNKFGVGTTAKLFFDDNTTQIRQLINTKGYMSSVSAKVHFGLGKHAVIKKIIINWPDGKSQELDNVKSNQLLQISYKEAVLKDNRTLDTPTLFENVEFNFKHKDSVFDDFEIQLLLPHKLSQLGPAVASADVNNDGFQDIYLGGGYMQEGQLLLGSLTGKFNKLIINDFIEDNKHEDIGAAFFDADNDGDDDLYVVSGSYEFAHESYLQKDRLYLNDGKGNFTKCNNCLSEFYESGSIVVPADFDKDGDIDLFIGGRVMPGKYPKAPSSYILVNTNGYFEIKTKQIAPDLARIGMVTDAHWSDIDNDTDLDLIVAGEWMGIQVFINKNGKLSQDKNYNSLSSKVGWWNRLIITDVDGDGDQDIVAGNLGLNSKYYASEEKPFHIYTKDFDYNGTEDIFLAKNYNGKQVPVRGKSCTAQQMPALNEKIKSYQDFASKDINEILGQEINTALHYKATEFRSGIFINDGHGKFLFNPFLFEVQKSPVNSILYDDFDNDGNMDLLLAGNNYQTEVETTRLDAGIGSLLKGNGKGDFTFIPNYISGFYADRDVRNMVKISSGDDMKILVINNNESHRLFVKK